MGFMSKRYTLKSAISYREEIRKSRFLVHAGPVDNADAALAFVARQSDPTASHNCWAYRIGQAYRFHDAGEPGGTAGRPILQAIEGQDCDRVVVVVTRWFGGILLGGGGLMRAYGGCAARCLRLAEKTPVVDTIAGEFACTFAELPVVKARLRDFGAEVQAEHFNETGAVLTLSVEKARVRALAQMLADLSRGRSALEMQTD